MKLKELLDSFYDSFDFKERVLNDPIEFPSMYKTPGDIEVSGLIAASFAYGKVTLFKPVIRQILEKMGKSPYEFLINFDVKNEGKLFSGISYRFNRNEDVLAFLLVIGEILKNYGSIKTLFLQNFNGSIYNSISGFVQYALSVNTEPVYGNNRQPSGFLQFFPDPVKGSACKRINMYLRWMVRNKDIDFGLWTEIPPSDLVIPLDTHISKVARCLGLTKRKANDWRAAVEITQALSALDPLDPLKYDFALCHHGISGACKGEGSSECDKCSFAEFNLS
ncbi:TIGR02757 family protein [Candidatus Magnetomonas plexicatena]|uniref:TIGR02757 family protein n=1 Tax=Candidatus Magnetomonas plexicatena TaxID=2552947 RepID=UPI001C75314F|nr:TIGR02757 family protein [Nitrospirales bacterium LBB_01]